MGGEAFYPLMPAALRSGVAAILVLPGCGAALASPRGVVGAALTDHADRHSTEGIAIACQYLQSRVPSVALALFAASLGERVGWIELVAGITLAGVKLRIGAHAGS